HGASSSPLIQHAAWDERNIDEFFIKRDEFSIRYFRVIFAQERVTISLYFFFSALRGNAACFSRKPF
ncbi:MAG: hypothetical protein Q6370_008380, partial [Candidatus Sigynarchaeota archaeon]